MKKIRLLTVTFDTQIKSWEIPAFRGAIISKVGTGGVLFHNHLSDTQLNYRYPLIQYKTIAGKPTIQCLEYGVDEIHKFFENSDWSLRISDRTLDMKIDQLNLNTFTMQVWDKKFRYSIQNWIALNTENFAEYQKLEGIADRMKFLEGKLTANIISFAKGIDWTIDKPIELSITELYDTKPVKLKGQTVLGFNLNFSTNVFLPNYIGLGKSVSLGYGVIKSR